MKPSKKEPFSFFTPLNQEKGFLIEEEKEPGKGPVVIFLVASLLLHFLLFYLYPKFPKPAIKSEKPISVKLLEEPSKGEEKAPKKATVLGEKNKTVKKETRPEDKPMMKGSHLPVLPVPTAPPPLKKAAPLRPQEKKEAITIAPRPKTPAPKKKTPLSKKKAQVKKPKHKKQTEKHLLTTNQKSPVKVAKAYPKPLKPVKPSPALTSPPASLPRQGEKKPGMTPPLPRPKSLFPSAKTLHQIERKFSSTYPKNINKGNSISLNTREFKYISYFSHIKRKIELVWEYPRLAAMRNQEGSLLLKFIILKNGTLKGVYLLQSSGYRLLDNEALRAVKDAAPFNPIPDRLKTSHLNITATFNYSLGFHFLH
jgi:protein TonB